MLISLAFLVFLLPHWNFFGDSRLEHAFTVEAHKEGWQDYDSSVKPTDVTNQSKHSVGFSLHLDDRIVEVYD